MILKNPLRSSATLFSACVLISACNGGGQSPAAASVQPTVTKATPPSAPVTAPSGAGKGKTNPPPYFPMPSDGKTPPANGSGGSSGASGASGSAQSLINGAEATQLVADREADDGAIEAPFISKGTKTLSAATWMGCAEDVTGAIENENTGFLLLEGSSLAFGRDLRFTYENGDSLYNGRSAQPLSQFFCSAPTQDGEGAKLDNLPKDTVIKRMKVGESLTDTLKFSATNVVHDFKGSQRATITCTDAATLNAALAKNQNLTGIQLLTHSSLVVVRDAEYDILGMMVKDPMVAPYAVYRCE